MLPPLTTSFAARLRLSALRPAAVKCSLTVTVVLRAVALPRATSLPLPLAVSL